MQNEFVAMMMMIIIIFVFKYPDFISSAKDIVYWSRIVWSVSGITQNVVDKFLCIFWNKERSGVGQGQVGWGREMRTVGLWDKER